VAQQFPSVVVIGAELVALQLALLARRGYRVLVLEQALLPGDASTFKRKGFTFDGSNAGSRVEPGGFTTVFSQLEIDPEATPCDPACAVYLPGETEPINVWRDPERWQKNGSGSLSVVNHFGSCWQLCSKPAGRFKAAIQFCLLV